MKSYKTEQEIFWQESLEMSTLRGIKMLKCWQATSLYSLKFSTMWIV